MKEINYIIDQSLPITQDFKSLKEEGLAHIQKVGGNEWTNLNPSDPGVTILDQLCYALTELGYCNDFPIQDILTNSDDKLIVKDQFYLPEEILTTSPITTKDYIKYIVDEVSDVLNALLVPIQSNLPYIKGVYNVYLSIDSSADNPVSITTICNTVFYRLNKRRNIGELFLIPVPLKRKVYTLSGKLEISNEVSLSKILSLMESQINNHIFPKAIQEDDNQLLLDGEDVNIIYNGPEMKHGYISDSNLGEKKDRITTRNLVTIMLSINGVINIQHLQINGIDNGFATSTTNELITFDLSKLEFIYTNIKNNNSTISNESLSGTDIPYANINNSVSKFPKGKFRDINSYYSIQNTFPEIYAVGENAINSNASDFQIAQSRQLKGYLTLFDQVLANQFSQLANVPQLFSFKNGITGTPSELKNFYVSKTPYEKEHLKYPVPYLSFSPTYFYQSLYTIPNIKPLFKNNDAFNFSLEARTKNIAEEISWKKFKDDPYNSYIRGLQNLIEDETINLNRRNEILDHLLARHGESPLLINTIIEGSVYTGNSAKDKIIIKSLYLQNLGLLSYYRIKGYNYLGAKKIEEIKLELPLNIEQLLIDVASVRFYLESEKDSTISKNEKFENDFIFNTNKVDQIEKIRKQDFINYAALELQLNILLSLKTPYINYLENTLNNLEEKKCALCDNKQQQIEKCPNCQKELEQIQQCLWFLKERKGLVCIENCLLHPFDHTIAITQSIENGPYYKIKDSLSYAETIALYAFLENASKITIDTNSDTGKIVLTINAITYELVVITQTTGINWKQTTAVVSDCFFGINLENSSEELESIPTITLLFPDYIPYFNTDYFKNRLDTFLENTLPIEVSYSYHFINQETLNSFIPAYIDWHNNLIYNNSGYKKTTGTTAALFNIINNMPKM